MTRLTPPKSAIGRGVRGTKREMRVYRYELKDIKVGDPVAHVANELRMEGFSRTTFPGGGSDIKPDTTSIVWTHQDGRRARVELKNGGITSVERFAMRPAHTIRR